MALPATAERRPDVLLGALRISDTSREVWLGGEPVPLTTQEFELLSLLAHRAGELVSRDEVFRTMRGIDYDGLDRSIDGRVSKLRRKLGDDAAAPSRIKTVWGKGYLLVPDAWEDAEAASRRDGAGVKEWLAAGGRGLFIRSYIVLAGGLLIVAILLDVGFGALQSRQTRAADPWLDSTLRLMESGLMAVPPEDRAARATELGQTLGLEMSLLEAGDIAGSPAPDAGPRELGRRFRQDLLPVEFARAQGRHPPRPVRAAA